MSSSTSSLQGTPGTSTTIINVHEVLRLQARCEQEESNDLLPSPSNVVIKRKSVPAKDEDEGTNNNIMTSETSSSSCFPRRQRRRRFLVPSASTRSLSFGKEEEDHSVSTIMIETNNNNNNHNNNNHNNNNMESSTYSSSSITVTPRKRPPMTLKDPPNDNNGENGSSSLFGTVMQRALHLGNVVDDNNQHTQHNNNIMCSDHLHSTPVGTGQLKDDDGSARSQQQLQSPGGFTLMNLLKNANSPYKRMIATNSPEEKLQDNTRDWGEASFGRDFVNVWDWSLKSRLQLESSPSANGTATAATALASLPRLVDAQGMQQFILQKQQLLPLPQSFAAKTTTTSVIAAAADGSSTNLTANECDLMWQSCLLYWQYEPCRHDDDYSQTNTTSNVQQHSMRARMSSDSMKGRENQTIDGGASRQDHLLTTEKSIGPGNGRTPKEGLAAATKLSQHVGKVQREWQEAFWSLSRQWLHTVTQLLVNADTPLTAQQVSQSYFYAIGNRQTVLFRVGRMMARKDSLSSSSATVPMIVLSSTTVAVRDKLRRMRIKLWCMDAIKGQQQQPEEEPQEFVENGDDTETYPETASMSTLEPHSDDSPMMKKELELLRRAQSLGATVGADVSVKWRKSKRQLSTTTMMDQHDGRRRRLDPPLYVSGMDDCVAFCEVYLNTMGFTVVDDDGESNVRPKSSSASSSKLPLLCCRHLGPFLHSNLKTLRVSNKRRRNTSAGGSNQGRPKSSHDLGHKSNTMMMDVVEVQGLILPCAYNQMVCSAIQRMLVVVDHDDDNGKDDAINASNDNHTNESRHLVLYAKQREDEGPSASGQSSQPRVPSSALLNGVGGTEYTFSSSTVEDTCVKECHHGHAMSVAVWDLSRQDAIAFKIDHVMP